MNNQPTSLQPRYKKGKLKLIEATLESLMAEGSEGASIRKICDRANVSIGLVNYHFTSINELLAAAYKHLSMGVLSAAVDKSEVHAGDPRRRLSAFMEEIFSHKVLQPSVLRAWLVFWGMVDSSTAIRVAHDEVNTASWEFLEQIIIRMDEQSKVKLSPRLAAIGLSSMIDGLWLEKCLQPDTFTAIEAVRLCEFWVDAIT